MKTYKVKTRNWNGNRRIAGLLDLTQYLGVSAYRSPDEDNKYIIETKNPLKAWTVWLYFMALRHFSGGWTYIVRPGHDIGPGYKAVY